MDLTLSTEQQELRRRARELADTELRPWAAHWDEEEIFPERSFELLAAAGFTGLTVPAEHGGQGLGVFEACLVLEQIATACLASAMSLQMCVNGPPRALLTVGTRDQQERHLPRVARGEAWFAIAMTEPQAGSDALALQTALSGAGDELRLNGTKCYITGGHRATNLLVFCRAEGTTRAEGIGAVLVDAAAPGFTVEHVEPKMGGRGVGEATLSFRDVHIPEQDVVLWPRVGSRDGARLLIRQFNPERCGNAAMAIGTAVGAYELAVDHVRRREQFGRPLADLQGIRWKLADMALDIDAARLLMWRAASAEKDGFPPVQETVMAKLYASEMVQRVSNQALQLHGHLGYTRTAAVERYFRDARGFTLGGGTSEVARNIIGRTIVDPPD